MIVIPSAGVSGKESGFKLQESRLLFFAALIAAMTTGE
jgi:hypothetical protein